MGCGYIETIKENLEDATIAELTAVIRDDWQKPNFAAVPYINSMASIDSKTDDGYGFDMPGQQVSYFLGNAGTWRGETARAVKAELKRRIK